MSAAQTIFFSYSGARVRTTAALVSRGVCIMSDNVLAGWSVLTEWPRLRLGHSVRTDRQLVHYPIHLVDQVSLHVQEFPNLTGIWRRCLDHRMTCIFNASLLMMTLWVARRIRHWTPATSCNWGRLRSFAVCIHPKSLSLRKAALQNYNLWYCRVFSWSSMVN